MTKLQYPQQTIPPRPHMSMHACMHDIACKSMLDTQGIIIHPNLKLPSKKKTLHGVSCVHMHVRMGDSKLDLFSI